MDNKLDLDESLLVYKLYSEIIFLDTDLVYDTIEKFLFGLTSFIHKIGEFLSTGY